MVGDQYEPGTCLSSILGLQPSKTTSFPINAGVIFVGFQENVLEKFVILPGETVLFGDETCCIVDTCSYHPV